MKLLNSTEWLFFHLWKKNPETGLSCPGVNIPNTIFFRWAQPDFFYVNTEQGELDRYTRDTIQIDDVIKCFSDSFLPNGISVLYINEFEKKIDDEEFVQLEYLTHDDCKNIFFQSERTKNCMIQNIVRPQKDCMNFIKVNWCPRFCIITRRTNKNVINSKNVEVLNEMVTFEGPDHQSVQDPIRSPTLENLIEKTCHDIAQHIQEVSGDNIQIARMSLYFRCDNNSQLWLSFVTRMKIRDTAKYSSNQPNTNELPEQLSPRLIAVPNNIHVDEAFLKRYVRGEISINTNIKSKTSTNCVYCQELVEKLFPVQYRYIIQDILEGDKVWTYDEIKAINTFILDQFDTNNSNNGLQGEKWKCFQLKQVTPIITNFIYYGTQDLLHIEDLISDYFWLKIIVYICEDCYQNITKIMLEDRMKNQFNNEQPKRDNFVSKQNKVKKNDSDGEDDSDEDSSTVKKESSNRNNTLKFIKGKINTGQYNKEVTLKNNVLRSNESIQDKNFNEKSIKKFSKVISKPTPEQIDEASREIKKYYEKRQEEEIKYRTNFNQQILEGNNKNSRFYKFIQTNNVTKKLLKKFTHSRNSYKGNSYFMNSVSDVSSDPERTNNFFKKKNTKEIKYNIYGELSLPNWKVPIVTEPSELRGFDNYKKSEEMKRVKEIFKPSLSKKIVDEKFQEKTDCPQVIHKMATHEIISVSEESHRTILSVKHSGDLIEKNMMQNAFLKFMNSSSTPKKKAKCSDLPEEQNVSKQSSLNEIMSKNDTKALKILQPIKHPKSKIYDTDSNIYQKNYNSINKRMNKKY